MDLVFYAFALVIFVVFCIFSVTSYLEKEKRAMWISALITVSGTGIFILMTMLGGDLKALLLLLVGIGLFVLLLLSALPIGRIQNGNDIPDKRFDERDVMFARARLKPGSPNYQAYYEMRPENQKIDDNTRSKPGLLSPDAKLANEFLFASPEASFTLTEVMGEMVAGTPAERKITLPIDKMTGYIKGLAGFYGALDVGVTELHPYHVYSHIGRGQGIYGAEIPVKHEFAIAFTVEMDHAMVAANPQPPGAMETAKEYVEAGRVAVQLVAAIRQMGFRARAHIDGNYRVIAPLVARDAGLGEIGRMSLLMTPRQGPRVRLGAVTTDLELFVDERVPDMSVIDFCSICKKCAENCPSKSISFEDRQEVDGALRWRINPESCFLYWNVIGTDCGICMTVCPYSHPDSPPHNLLRWGIKRSGFVRRGALWMDDLFYGKEPPRKEAPEWTQVP
ncbi:MAG TPA: 4Fe-4S dicluster domain-containing protein [Anaerolineales bacterium]|nr:4Fe-4S dicluster domain-containing protein [Anaerolineales bacterium]